MRAESQQRRGQGASSSSSPSPRGERNHEQRQRRPRSTQAAEETVVVKIPAVAQKRVDAMPEIEVSTIAVTPVAAETNMLPASGEDIFSRAQQMLAEQGRPITESVSSAAEVLPEKQEAVSESVPVTEEPKANETKQDRNRPRRHHRYNNHRRHHAKNKGPKNNE